MAIEFPDDAKKRITTSLNAYVQDEFGEDLGDLRMVRLYEFLVGLIGAAAYNQGVADAQAWLHNKLIDLEIELHEDVRDRRESGPN
jgi:uncharacterized protein (DUF2164 family)